MGKLTATRVEEILKDCLYKDEELPADPTSPKDLPDGAVFVMGIINNYGFHPGRLEQHKPEIRDLLAELPAEFTQGMSFLSACMDRHGEQWGEHRNMEQLFVLGMAVELVEECAPREMWPALPGGMPYYLVKPTTETVSAG